MSTIEYIFIFSLLGALFSYIIYPLILITIRLGKAIFRRKVRAKLTVKDQPSITFIIAAFNEGKKITKKLENTLTLDYPKEKLEIIVASDGCTDETNSLVRKFSGDGVRLVNVPERKGKENAQLYAISQAKGDILVFSDVATRLKTDALHLIVESFNDSEVGAVSSEDQFITDDGEVAGEGAYVKYEMWLRKLESDIYSLVGLSGSFFAARKEICDPWDTNIPSDFNTAINCVVHGKVAISNPKVLGIYPNLANSKNEYQRKLRTVIRGLSAVSSRIEILNPFKYGLFSFMILSHKIMRWLVPWFLVTLFISNLLIYDQNWFYFCTFSGQIVTYALFIGAHLFEKMRDNTLIKIVYFFIQVNIAIAHATLQFIGGRRITMWTPSKR